MTSNIPTLRLSSLDIPSIHKFGVGFDSIFDEFNRIAALGGKDNYPPYNIIKESDDAYIIELAVAGFKQNEVEIEMEKNVLTVKSVDSEEPKIVPEYLHKGISARSFTRSFTLADHVEVLGATMQDGILAIQLQRKVPEALQPRKIAIEYTK
jgi:molecular chaperone IbpA